MKITLPTSSNRYSPTEINRTFHDVRTVDDAIKTDESCLLGLIRKGDISRGQIETLIKLHLIALDAFLKQKNGLSVEEIELIAEEVMASYGGGLTFADIHVIFRDAKLGKYGELYNSLSCSKIIKWFDEYFSYRCNRAYEINLQKDRLRYNIQTTVEGNELLRKMGYTLGEDGNVFLNKDGTPVIDYGQVAANAAQHNEKKPISHAEKEAAYRAWKSQYIAKNMRNGKYEQYTKNNTERK